MNDATIIVGMDRNTKKGQTKFNARFANDSFVVGDCDSPEQAISFLLNREYKPSKRFAFLWGRAETSEVEKRDGVIKEIEETIIEKEKKLEKTRQEWQKKMAAVYAAHRYKLEDE